MKGAWVDRRREGWEDESDAAFLERVDVLVMAEWDQRRRASNLRQLHADYAVRTEFLSILQHRILAREDGPAALPGRRELELLLAGVRQARGEERVEEWELAPTDALAEEPPGDVTAGITPNTCP